MGTKITSLVTATYLHQADGKFTNHYESTTSTKRSINAPGGGIIDHPSPITGPVSLHIQTFLVASAGIPV